ncbi:Hypothetical protein A7982_02640 [Minicystis rosea]|nr:Hypothetical protein A7982_02640 [Minicystis rosea]
MTSPEPNPYAPPIDDHAPQTGVSAPTPDDGSDGPPQTELVLAEPGKGEWTIQMYPTKLRFVPPDARLPRVMTHDVFVRQATFRLGAFSRFLVLEAPIVNLKVVGHRLTVLRAWLEPAIRDHLAYTLKKRRTFKLLIGMLLVGTALSPLDIASLAVGAAWILWAAATTKKPIRALFLIEAILWVPFAIWPVLRVIGGASPWNLIFVLFVVHIIAGILELYRFYAPIAGSSASARA